MTDELQGNAEAVTPSPERKKESGGWCSLIGGILAFIVFGVLAFGGAIGFAMMGGPPQTPFNPGITSSPAATSAPTASPPPTATLAVSYPGADVCGACPAN